AEVTPSLPTMHTAVASRSARSRPACNASIAANDSTLTFPSSKRSTATPSSMVVVTGGGADADADADALSPSACAMGGHPNGRHRWAPSEREAADLDFPRIFNDFPRFTKQWLTGLFFDVTVGHKDHLKTEFARKVLGQLEI